MLQCLRRQRRAVLTGTVLLSVLLLLLNTIRVCGLSPELVCSPPALDRAHSHPADGLASPDHHESTASMGCCELCKSYFAAHLSAILNSDSTPLPQAASMDHTAPLRMTLAFAEAPATPPPKPAA
jgi:hypothetical protein